MINWYYMHFTYKVESYLNIGDLLRLEIVCE